MTKRFKQQLQKVALRYIQELPDIGMFAVENPEPAMAKKLYGIFFRIAEASARIENSACRKLAHDYDSIFFEDAESRQKNISKAISERWPEGKKK